MPKKKDSLLEAERKKQIILTTYRLLIKGSTHDLTLDKVAKQARLSKGLVIYYFKNRDNLITETMQAILLEEKNRLLSLAAGVEPVTEKTNKLVEAGLTSRQEIENMTLFLIETWSYAKNNPATQKAIIKNALDFRSICKTFVEIGKQAGAFQNLDEEMLSIFLYSLFEGLSIQITMDKSLDVGAIKNFTLTLLKIIMKQS
ncbi:TetR/AcrR family transcriptional regulator [bacterium]|nr:TetR/AcrR family transcriptional regulator [bacterium]